LVTKLWQVCSHGAITAVGMFLFQTGLN